MNTAPGAPPRPPTGDVVTALVLVAVVAGHLWTAFGQDRGRLVLAVVARQDLVGRHQIQTADVEVALVRVSREERWLHAPSAAVQRFVRPTPAPGPALPMIRAGEPVYASQLATGFPLPVWERGLAVAVPSTHVGTVPPSALRPEDRVDVYVGSPPADAKTEGAAKPAAPPPLLLAARAVRVLGVEAQDQEVRVHLWLTGEDASDVARRLLAPSAPVLLVKR